MHSKKYALNINIILNIGKVGISAEAEKDRVLNERVREMYAAYKIEDFIHIGKENIVKFSSL